MLCLQPALPPIQMAVLQVTCRQMALDMVSPMCS